MDELICPICGEPTRVYMGNARKDRLCGKHADMLKSGEIIVNENGVFVDSKTKKVLNKDSKIKTFFKNQLNDFFNKNEEDQETKAKTTELNCLLCGENSNVKHFCLKCYNKYKDRAIDVRIINCKDIEIIDAYGNLQYKCEDGRKVRSKSEKIISDFLFKYGIRTIYEKTVYYYPNEKETITLHPDFYLPDYDCYIEHNGMNTKSYKANKEKTEEMYKTLGYKVIVTTETDLADIEAKLKPALRIN